MLFCCLRRNVRLLVINTSSSSTVKNKLRRLPTSSVNNSPRSIAAVCIALGSRTVHCTRWSQILAENRDFCLPHLHSTPQLGGRSPSEYCHNVWCGKLECCSYPMVKNWRYVFFLFDRVSSNVTDGQADTAWRHRLRLCIASRGKNWQDKNNTKRFWQYTKTTAKVNMRDLNWTD